MGTEDPAGGDGASGPSPEAVASENSTVTADAISREIERVSALVPWIGESWRRWYDYPYRLLEVLTVKRRWWRAAPPIMRHGLSRILNGLILFNEYDRERIADLGNPLYNVLLPANERVETPVLWVTELYSPAYAGRFSRALIRRSWPSDRLGNVPGSELKSQLRRLRERDSGFAGRVGSFIDPDSKAWWIPDAKRERLPEGFERVEVHVEALGPALTAIVAAFYLDEETRNSLDAVLRSEHPPRLVRANGRIHLYQRLFQGISDVQGERARVHRAAREWLAKKVPGIFATEGGGQLPVLDMVLTHSYDPLAGDPSRDRGNYLRALGLEPGSWSQIVLPELHGFCLSEYRPERLRQDDRAQWTLAANYEEALSDADFKYYADGSRTARSIAARVDDGSRRLLTRLAITELLDLKTREMNRSRDIANSIHSGFRPARSIKELRRSLLTRSIDIAAIAHDVRRLAADRRRYEFNVPTLWLQPGRWQTEISDRAPDVIDKELLAYWAKRQTDSVAQLLEADRSLTTSLGVVASLTSSLSGVRSQRWAIFLSVSSLAAAAAAAWLAYVAVGLGK